MSEASRLAAFLVSLQTSRSARERFKEDPEGEMKRFDLSSKTIKAVNDGDREALWRILTRIPQIQVGRVIRVGKRRRRKSK